ncbi:MAG: CotH kinase family protein, partial [Lachnospiraceae bacterium]|nr:CotH kinase family protein [Lachnospiraceae bacterium]
IDSPKYITLNELEYISKFVSDFEEAINAKNGRNSQDIYYMDYIDATSWADKMIIEELFSNWDMDYASQFFYKDTDDNKLHAGPVWDYDLSCGHVDGLYTSKTDTNVLFINEHHFGMHGWWYERLYSHGDFKKLMTERYEKEFYPRIPGLVGMVLPGLNEQIEQSTIMDSLRWSYEKDENLDTLCDYVEGKSEYLYDLWVNNTKYHKVTMVYDVYGEKNYYIVGVKDGEILKDYPEVDAGDGEFLGWYVDNKPYSVNAIVKDDLTLVAKVQQNTSPKSRIMKLINAVKSNIEIIPIVFFVLLIPAMIIYEKKRG